MGFGYLGDWTQTGEEFLLTIESRSFLRQTLQLLGRSLTLCTLLSQSDNNNKETSKPPTSITQSFFMHAGFTQNFNIGLMTNLWILLSWNVLNSKFNICVFNWFFNFYGARVHILPFPPALPYPTLHSYPLCQTVPDCPICPPFHIPSCYATTIFLLASPNSLVLFNYKPLTASLRSSRHFMVQLLYLPWELASATGDYLCSPTSGQFTITHWPFCPGLYTTTRLQETCLSKYQSNTYQNRLHYCLSTLRSMVIPMCQKPLCHN